MKNRRLSLFIAASAVLLTVSCTITAPSRKVYSICREANPEQAKTKLVVDTWSDYVLKIPTELYVDGQLVLKGEPNSKYEVPVSPGKHDIVIKWWLTELPYEVTMFPGATLYLSKRPVYSMIPAGYSYWNIFSDHPGTRKTALDGNPVTGHD